MNVRTMTVAQARAEANGLVDPSKSALATAVQGINVINKYDDGSQVVEAMNTNDLIKHFNARSI